MEICSTIKEITKRRMKLYRETKELPKDRAPLVVKELYEDTSSILCFVEPIEITEEEIKRVITEEMEEGAFGANVIDHFVPKLTKAILSKLKGE